MDWRNIILAMFMLLWSAAATLSLTWGSEIIWPDYVHVNYGFPLTWGVHTLNTIHGPVDIWKVNLSALFIDLVFWFAIMILVILVFVYLGEKTKAGEKR
jgi:hypothetical protein